MATTLTQSQPLPIPITWAKNLPTLGEALRAVIPLISSLLLALPACAQSLDDLNIQIHGFAVQGFLYTTSNNIFSTNSSDGSPAWTEDVLNISAQPIPKLSVAVQGRYFLLGSMANGINIDYAAADYKVNDRFGVRFGKVKTPSGLYNETQDVSPSYLWALLPQSIYLIGSRNSQLAHYGAVTYGTLDCGSRLGKLEYRAWAGARVIGGDDSYFQDLREASVEVPSGTSGTVSGIALHWLTPLRGLTLGASDSENQSTTARVIYDPNGALGTLTTTNNQPDFFARFERKRVLIAAEYDHAHTGLTFKFPSFPSESYPFDVKPWFVMASYRLTHKLNLGAYRSYTLDRDKPQGNGRFVRDWTISSRYDFNGYLYAKAEEHFITGTLVEFDQDHNPSGLKPSTQLTVLKIGVSF